MSKNNKKIKQQYRNSYEEESYNSKVYTYYPNIKSDNIKIFSNLQEKSYSQIHEIEYKKEYGLKIRGKRNKGLANCWDDYPSYVSDLGKSWKNNSKRKNQYFREK